MSTGELIPAGGTVMDELDRAIALANSQPEGAVPETQSLAVQIRDLLVKQNERVAALEQERRSFDRFHAEINQRFVEIMHGKQVVLDPVLSQRLQTMANSLSAPTYVVEDRNGKVLNIMAVGSYAGTVKIVVDTDRVSRGGI